MSVVKLGNIASTTTKDAVSNASVEELTASTGKKIYAFELDNRDNPTTHAFLKLWDEASAPTVGTDHPDFLFKVPAGKKWAIAMGSNMTGVTIAGLLYGATMTGPASSNTSSPAEDVYLTIATNEL